MTYLDPDLFTSFDCYELARLEAEKIDLHLGFEVARIENELLKRARELHPEGNHKTWGQLIHQGNQTWVGLSHQTLQTPYSELKLMCQLLNLKDGSKIIDLGAGYGRMGLILDALYPQVEFLGYEYVTERVDEGMRIFKKYQCQKAQLLQQDLTDEDFSLPEADYYFLYDYGTVTHIRKTLKQFEILADRKHFKLIARGKGVLSLIQFEHPWLAHVFPAIHAENFSIFSTTD